MRLGVVMTGYGAFAAANGGVLRALMGRGIEPYAVCGMQFGALEAAHFLCAGSEEERRRLLLAASRMGRRLLGAPASSRQLLAGRRRWLTQGLPLGALLKKECNETLLALCPRRAIFPCALADSAHRVIFSSVPYAKGEENTLSVQATVGFAARAAMACPPILSPMPWLDSVLLAQDDVAWACDQLIKIGADCVLAVCPCAAPGHEMDALELLTAKQQWRFQEMPVRQAAVLRVTMPAGCGALSFERMAHIEQAGYQAAAQRLDDLLRSVGMSPCRVLPFVSRAQRVRCRG